jgi:hypothetical protein
MLFSVLRDRATLECLYPLDDPKYLAYVARQRGDVVGWVVAVNTQMRDHNHFGNLRVATVLDAGALPSAAAAVASHMRRALAAAGAELVVTNQTHACWLHAFRRAGFLNGPSNYLFATSKRLSQSIGAGVSHIHVTRGDGDGRIHL